MTTMTPSTGITAGSRQGTGRYPTKPCRNYAARDHFNALLSRNRPIRGMGPLAGVLWFFPRGSKEYDILRGTQLDESGRKWTVFRFFGHTPPLAVDGGGPHALHHALPPLCATVRSVDAGGPAAGLYALLCQDQGNGTPLLGCQAVFHEVIPLCGVGQLIPGMLGPFAGSPAHLFVYYHKGNTIVKPFLHRRKPVHAYSSTGPFRFRGGSHGRCQKEVLTDQAGCISDLSRRTYSFL